MSLDLFLPPSATLPCCEESVLCAQRPGIDDQNYHTKNDESGFHGVILNQKSRHDCVPSDRWLSLPADRPRSTLDRREQGKDYWKT
jgi:hypothetical protein